MNITRGFDVRYISGKILRILAGSGGLIIIKNLIWLVKPPSVLKTNNFYDEEIKNYPGACNRKNSEKFLKDNASFIDY